ncbi:hypothetical protein EII17_01130 [Clostridiales bacterium COT073_COT-073]|nr:hypothetical protein EII17_01130 [Clostridiales bacterium COT073_COT-073]
MKRIIGLLILIAVLSGIFYWIYVTEEKKQESKQISSSNALNEAKIVELLEDKNAKERERILQTASKSPDQVIALNALILKITYGKELNKEQMDDLISIQRYQFAEELLSKNEESDQQLKVWLESEKQKEKKIKIVDYKALAPYPMDKVKYDGVPRNTVKVSVVYYTNVAGNNLYIDYLLYEDDNRQWKIVGWARGEEFLVTE